MYVYIMYGYTYPQIKSNMVALVNPPLQEMTDILLHIVMDECAMIENRFRCQRPATKFTVGRVKKQRFAGAHKHILHIIMTDDVCKR